MMWLYAWAFTAAVLAGWGAVALLVVIVQQIRGRHR